VKETPSRARVKVVLSGGCPDRPPVDFMGTGCGLGEVAHRRLVEHVGLGRPAGAPSEPQSLERVTEGSSVTVYDPAVLERFGVDFRRVGLRFGGALPAAGLAEEARGVRDLTGRAVVARTPGPGPLGWCLEKEGFERFLVELRRRERDAAALVGRAVEELESRYRLLLGAVGPLVDLVELADDYAFAGGPLISPEVFDRVFRPALGRLVRVIRALAPGARILFHSCGSIVSLLDGLAAAGVDVVSPLDPTGRGMEPKRLKRAAARLRTPRGGRLVLHGGLDPRVLTGSPRDVRREVKRLATVLGEGGGYILAPAGDILEDVPPENIQALFEAAGSLS